MTLQADPALVPPPAKLSHEEINRLPVVSWEGEVVLVDSPERLEEAEARLTGAEVLGFDTETRPAFRKGQVYHPSLVQLASQEAVFLFQLANLPDPAPLLRILEDPERLKSGVALSQDIRQLQAILSFRPAGFVDLGEAAHRARYPHQGLRGLAALLLQVRISKKAQCSNWAAPRLDSVQISYAATDAWISRQLYLVMQSRGLFD